MINGGVGSAVWRIARNLANSGINIHVIAPGPHASGMAITPVLEEGVTVHRTYPELSSYYGNPESLREIGEYVGYLHREIDFDLIHGVFLVPAGLVAAEIAAEIDRPLIISIRGSDVELMRYHPTLCGTVRWVLRRASLVTSVTSDLLEKAQRIANIAESRVISNAYDPTVFDSWPLREMVAGQRWSARFLVEKFLFAKAHRGLVIGTTGVIRHAKGFHILIEAFKNLLDIHKDAFLLIVGDFMNRKEKKVWAQRIKHLGLKRRVFITGRIPHRQVLAWVKEMDIFAFPSLHEGSPNALLEAMGCGIPTVASNVGGVLDLITDGKNGLLVPPSNVDALTQSLNKLVLDESLRIQLGKLAKHTIQTQCSPEQEIEAWKDAYHWVTQALSV